MIPSYSPWPTFHGLKGRRPKMTWSRPPMRRTWSPGRNKITTSHRFFSLFHYWNTKLCMYVCIYIYIYIYTSLCLCIIYIYVNYYILLYTLLYFGANTSFNTHSLLVLHDFRESIRYDLLMNPRECKQRCCCRYLHVADHIEKWHSLRWIYIPKYQYKGKTLAICQKKKRNESDLTISAALGQFHDLSVLVP